MTQLEKHAFEHKHLFSLVEHGYFANIFSTKQDTVSVDCTVYFSDYDCDTGSHTMVRMHPGDPVTDDGICVACNEATASNEGRIWTAHSIMCPGCRFWTKTYTLTAKMYRGVFKITPGQPVEYLRPHTLPMPEHMATSISDALTAAYSEYFSEEKINSAWLHSQAQITQNILRAQEEAEDASIRTEQEEFAKEFASRLS